MTEHLKKILRHHFNLALILCIHFAFYVFFIAKKITLSDEEYQLAIVLVISLVSSFFLFNSVLAYIPNRIARALLNTVVIFCMLTFLFYKLVRKTALDFNLLYSNWSEIFAPASLRLIYQAGGILNYSLLVGITLAFILAELRWKILSNKKKPKNFVLTFIPLLILNIFFLLRIDQNPHEGFAFIKSIMRYYSAPEKVALLNVKYKTPYPLLRTEPRAASAFKTPPNIFIILMESFSAAYIDIQTPSGKEVTPFINSLIQKSIYHSRFFSNSMQTERGHISTLCSIIPALRGKMMQAYFENEFKCLPEILSQKGYQTLFANAQDTLNYDNAGNFMKKIGFQKVVAMEPPSLNSDEQKKIWGWGLEDDFFFKKVFSIIDKLDSSKPVFATLATISHHQPFTEMPPDSPKLYKTPANFLEKYQNSLFLADSYLRTFFDELIVRKMDKNSLVILLGDHGSALDENGNTSNEKSATRSLFHIPLVVYGANSAWRNDSIAYSQNDIAPSLLHWLGISEETHFVGDIIPLQKKNLPKDQHMIHLVQPYDGVYVMSLFYPLKYAYNLASNQEFLFDLQADPHERVNLIPFYFDKPELKYLRTGLEPIFLNQFLLNENRIYPSR